MGQAEDAMISALIIEDWPSTRRVIRRAIMTMFEGRVRVVEADSATEAVSALRVDSFDVVISDFNLGATSGLDVLDFLRAEQPHMVDKFVFFTSTSGIGEVHHKVISKDDAARFPELLAVAMPSLATARAGGASS